MKKGIIKNIIYRIFNLRYKGSNKTIKEVLHNLRTKTHCGIYWNVKPRFHVLDGTCSIYMEGNEKYEYDMETGEMEYVDLDDW